MVNLQSTPRETHPIVTQQHKTSSTDLKTIKTEHFILLSNNGSIFYGLEIFVYVTITRESTERMLFVSKADTNGFNTAKVKIGAVTQTILNYLLNLPIDHYLKKIVPSLSIKGVSSSSKTEITRSTSTKDALEILIKRAKGDLVQPEKIGLYSIDKYPKPVKTKISLFTRAEPQYLFPESSRNKLKHILSGENLLKWWIKCLDDLVYSQFDQNSLLCKIIIPAEDANVIKRNYLLNLKSEWSVGDIFSKNPNDTAVFKIPVFPDDPKARFLEHLVVENRAKAVTLKQFWTELQIRQEFRLGVTVSVIGIEGTLKGTSYSTDTDIITLPLKTFKKVKNYVTGEDYSVVDGSVTASKNVEDYLGNLKHEIPSVVGQLSQPQGPPKPASKRADPPVNNLTTLVRKKQKK